MNQSAGEPDLSAAADRRDRLGRNAAAVSGLTGLSAAEAALTLRQYGPNVVLAERPTPLIRRVVGQLRDPLMVVLMCATVLTVATGDLTDAVVIVLVIVVNTTVGTAQEVRAAKAIADIGSLTAPRARVIRGGDLSEIPAEDVVPGDLLVVSEGDLVVADAELIETAVLAVDESSVTGESVPVDKEVAGEARSETGRLNAGSVVVRGRGVARVVATGSESHVGRLAHLLSGEHPVTPLQRRLRGLSRVLALVVTGLCAVVAIAGVIRGEPLGLMAVTAVSLAVAAVPESLPAVVTLSLALGARRMAARHAVVRNLAAVETLGSVTVVVTDKTGTLTEGTMVVQRLWTVDGEACVDGHGYRPTGRVVRNGQQVTAATAPDLAELLRSAVLCSDAVISPPADAEDQWHAVGDPTEAALVAAAGKLGVRRADAVSEAPRVAEFPFDSRRKRMTTVHRRGPRYLIVSKGAPEFLVDAAAIEPEAASSFLAVSHRLADEGLRVLAVAVGERSSLPRTVEEAEHGLALLGLIAMADPVKPAAAPTVATLRSAGIRPVLVTGDHPTTAAAIARQVGLLGPWPAGAQDPYPIDPSQRVGSAVVARATPEQKVAVIDAERRAGEVIAMTGDGVNDAPALRHADIGVAMGRRGTEVARQAADLVLADDELATLAVAVGEGRRVYANIRRFLLYGMSGGAAEVMVMLLGPFLGMPLPLLPAQILWINLLTHGLVGVALGAEPAEPNVLRRPPRPPEQSVLGAALWARILRISVFITSVTLAVGGWALVSGRDWQTLMFVTLGVLQLGVAAAVRAQPRTWQNPFLLLAIGCAVVLQIAAVYVPALTVLLSTRPPSTVELAVVLSMFGWGWLAVRLERRWHPR